MEKTSAWQTYSFIARSNLKRNVLPHLLLALLVPALAPALFGISYLDAAAAAIRLERFIALIGIVLLVPIFAPEQDKDIRDLTETKPVSQTGILLVRLSTAVLLMLGIIAGFACAMALSGSEFPLVRYVAGTFCGALFLGALGLFAYGISYVPVIGYMIPLIFYALNTAGDKYAGKLYLFSMSQGSFGEKYALFGAAALLLAATCFIRAAIRRLR
ncbi:MAG: hypothetical protein E7L01_05175 [Paenibacillus macerans]|uniref:Putative membrane protein n=1 Tax=Paenibacillus macerans TaxID=44252 RepID=A0A091A256_PAEMA|nr:hypothetical protein [Paenibacillus macerans]KFN10396.1 putative membrane protein [Paenibacillus macerans]MBS5909235.1 hypothetical protein [Paenibacillus macerans]MCY7556903.1 hypothetical protein [Paenibacillus macerans]MDU7472741.1 hypothetical protein [Paenibacillus macerans]MEC0139112.1 hypothetical protein [Paenibacillus macerans]